MLNNAALSVPKFKSVSQLKQIHAHVITLGDESLASNLITSSSLSDSGNVDYAYRILLSLSSPSIYCWNPVIRGYSISKNPDRSISVFIKMLGFGFSPDYLTYPFVVKASARLLNPKLGVSIHGMIVRTGFELDRFIYNSLIHMYGSFGDIRDARKVFDEMPMKNLVSWNSMLDGYAKCGNLMMARELFDQMPEKNVVSWSALIDGYVKRGDYTEALDIFEKIVSAGLKANEVTMVSLLCACAHLGELDKGETMNDYITNNNLPLTIILRTSLVDMYAKCGALDKAMAIFRSVPMAARDVFLWNTMIGGYAMHGFINESLGIFSEMQKSKTKPDEITYLCLLSACAHRGLVKQAWYFFHCIEKQGMSVTSEHYASLVDAMARAGQVEEAYRFLDQMSVEATPSMLGAILHGCTKYGNTELAEIIGKKLVKLDPNHDGRYVGLSNAYALERRWDQARSTREEMEMRGVKKISGFSFVEICGVLHRFIAHDQLHPCYTKIYSMLYFIVGEMKRDFDPVNEEHFF